jgi:hypothetical protein
MARFIMNEASSKMGVGAIVGIVIGSIAVLSFLIMAKDRYVDRPKRVRRNAAAALRRGGGGRQQEMGTRKGGVGGGGSSREIV